MNEQGEPVVLTDDEGNEHEFDLVDIIEVDGQRYAILGLPENEDEAIVLRVEEEDGEECLVTIDDDSEWERVAEAWEEMQEFEEEED